MRRDLAWPALALALLLTAAMYAPGFGGFWLGDDYPNLHRAYVQSQQGTLLADTLGQFTEKIPSQGAFYRPMMMASLAANYALGGAQYWAWYLPGFLVHLGNVLLVWLLVRRIAARAGGEAGPGAQGDAALAAPLAALWFGLCPFIGEGVYWVSARADGWVTLLTLAGLLAWLSPRGGRPWLLPALLVAALGFKESAAVLPLQLTLLAIALPGPLTRAQRGAWVLAFVVAASFMLWRAWLFGNAWQVYDAAPGGPPLAQKAAAAIGSLWPWMKGLAGHPLPALAYLALVAAALLLLARKPVPALRAAWAMAAAAGGLALATLLNLGSMNPLGEGGRLAYGPAAWLALALGVTLAAVPAGRPRRAGTGAIAAAALVGAILLHGQLARAWQAQADMRAITTSVPAWSAAHPGLTMLLVPDHDGAIVMARNGQGGMVMEPVQQEGLLHRVVPTLSTEVEMRRQQFCDGLAKRLEILRPRYADAATLAALAQKADTIWPRHLACWSPSSRRIVELTAPPMDVACGDWLAAVQGELAACTR